MIPEFPEFKPLEITDKNDVEKITHLYPPYSDFNFTSMWSWDVNREMQISTLNGNLIVLFSDYITGLPFYSFLGNNDVNDTAEKLLQLSAAKGIEPKLKLIPQTLIHKIDQQKFEVREDRDHFDYILSLESLADYEISKLRSHASFHRRFGEAHPEGISTQIINLNDPQKREEIRRLTKIWAQNKISQNKDLLPHLEDAVERYFMQETFGSDFVAVGIFHHNKLIAFNINELLNEGFCVCHFMKADNSFKGVYSYLVSESSKILVNEGKKYTNFEQDLGLPNLRQSKKTFNPIDFLKKYTITSIQQ